MKIKQGLYEDITANLDCDVTTMMTEVMIVSDEFPCFLAIDVKFQTLLPSFTLSKVTGTSPHSSRI
jgi:hypothetical protein